jgi:hypothetical protein
MEAEMSTFGDDRSGRTSGTMVFEEPQFQGLIQNSSFFIWRDGTKLFAWGESRIKDDSLQICSEYVFRRLLCGVIARDRS